MALDTCYRHRHKLALLTTLCAASSALLAPWAKLHAAPSAPAHTPAPIEIALAPEPLPVEPPPKPESKPLPAPKTPVPQPRPVAAPNRTATPAATPTVDTPSAHAPEPVAPAPTPAPVTTAAKPAEPTPVVPPAPVHPANSDASFADKIRQLVNASKSYPTGREVSVQRPEGTVEVCVTLARSGEVTDSSIRDSAGSILLDQAAKRLVTRLRYPAFEETAFKGQEQHEFCIRLKYEAPKN